MSRADSPNAHFTATLVDPTAQIRNSLQKATMEKPALITVHGYAQACQQSPLVSIQIATIAFKKT